MSVNPYMKLGGTFVSSGILALVTQLVLDNVGVDIRKKVSSVLGLKSADYESQKGISELEK